MIRTLTSIFTSVLEFSSGILEFLSRQYSATLPGIGEFSYTVFEFIFGLGVYIILSYWIVKWLFP